MDSPTFSSVASYSCDQGFGLQGDATRVCQADGTWSGRTPQCISEFPLNLIVCKDTLIEIANVL